MPNPSDVYVWLLIALSLSAPLKKPGYGPRPAGAKGTPRLRPPKTPLVKPPRPTKAGKGAPAKTVIIPTEELELDDTSASAPASQPVTAASAPASASQPTTPAKGEVGDEEGEEDEAIAASAPVPAAPPPPVLPPGHRLGLVLGAKVGGLFGFTGSLKLGLFAAVEIGYRLPWFDRLIGISLEPSFANPQGSATFAGGAGRSTSIILSLAVMPSLNFTVGPGLLRLLGGVILERYAVVTTFSDKRLDNSLNALSYTVGAGYFFYLGPGALGLDVRYRLLPYSVGAEEQEGHVLSACAAYLFLL